MKRITLIFTLMLAIVALIMPSCNSSNTGYEAEDDTLFDIVTVLTSTSAGTTYSVQQSDETIPVTLTSTVQIDTAQVGKRILLAYTLPTGVTQYTSSSISVVGALKVINDTVEVADIDNSTVVEAHDVVVAKAVGNYLDIKSQCDVYSTPKRFSLVMDKSTEDSEYPTLYLIFNSDNTINASQKDVYASFNISKLKTNSSYLGFNLVWKPLTSGATGTKTFKFANKLAPTPVE